MAIYVRSYSDDNLEVALETLIVLQVCKICDNENVRINVLFSKVSMASEPLFQIDSGDLLFNSVELEEVPAVAKYCKWPILLVGNRLIAGLASVCRQIIKQSNSDEIKTLLGFREASLMACNETSIWTKFCEIDIISTIKTLLLNPKKIIDSSLINIPNDFIKFENHMGQPIRIHNVYKLARVKNNDKLIKSNVPINELNLDHRYSEGPFMTLADLLLFPCFKIFFRLIEREDLKNDLPLTITWFENLLAELKQQKFSFLVDFEKPHNAVIVHEKIKNLSLYTGDPKRYKPHCRIYTRQNDIEHALTCITNLSLNDDKYEEPYGYEIDFSWSTLPLEVNPQGGSLPKSRASRKCHQLENLAKAAIKISRNKSHTIVDFCSGSGHLGILLAVLLPNSHMILVENKEHSLQRAQDTIAKLQLKNVSLVQSNLDYFEATFDVGVALHACGVATDLVIQVCIKNKAHFICCPCCYGGIHDCHHLTYPRSEMFKNDCELTYRDYLIIGHSADQTHDELNAKTAQGYVCMNVIDNDRKLQAEENGYTVHLGKLVPPSCTPKNNLLVGIYIV